MSVKVSLNHEVALTNAGGIMQSAGELNGKKKSKMGQARFFFF